MTSSAKPPQSSDKKQKSPSSPLASDNGASALNDTSDSLDNKMRTKDTSQEAIDRNTSNEDISTVDNADTDVLTAEIVDSDVVDTDVATSDEIVSDELDISDVEETTGEAQYPESEISMTSPSPDVVIATLETPDPETQIAIEVLDPKAQGQDAVQDLTDETDINANSNVEANIEAEVVDEPNLKSKPSITESNESTNTLNVSSVSDTFDVSDESDNTSIDSSTSTLTEDINEKEVIEKDLDVTTLIEGDSRSTNDISNNSDLDEITEVDENDAEDEGDEDQENELSAEEIEAEKVKEEKEEKLESYKQFVAEQFSNQKIDYPEVRVTIEANALPSRMYFVMNTLSAIIASYGLVTNSAAVVIGAMLVAMMLGPITGVALAIIDYRMPLLRKSLFTVVAGVSLVIVVGFIVGWLHKDQPLTAEVLSRTQPTSMDLMIALAGGTAGAYAMVSPHLSVAVVGVAVATALVPPLAASGILFANGEMTLGFGAALLAITNIIAIQFTNAMVLWFLGFRRLVDDDYKSSTYLTFFRRNAVTLLLLVGLGTYLTINLNKNARQQTFESNVKETINQHFIDKGNVLTNTQFTNIDGYQAVRAVIRGETTPSSYDVQQIEATITQDMADNFPSYLPIKIQLRYLPVQVIESNPLIQDQLDRTDAAILTN